MLEIPPILGTLGWFIVVLGGLVTVHELGHFAAAKLAGVRVERFSIGFGRKIFAVRRGETEYALSWIPLGGYVKMAGEAAGEEQTGAPDEFMARPPLVRLQVILAGPLMNALLAIVLTSLVSLIGVSLPAYLLEAPVIAFVAPDSPAAAAGLRPGDRVIAAAGRPADTVEQLTEAVAGRPGEAIQMAIERSGSRLELPVTVLSEPATGVGTIGIDFERPVIVGSLMEGYPAAQAGLKPDDEILAIDGRPLASPYDMQSIVEAGAGRELEFDIARAGERLRVALAPRRDPAGGRAMVGIVFGERTVTRRYGPLGALRQGFVRNWQIGRAMLHFLGSLVRRTAPLNALGGPILIAQATGVAARLGLVPLLSLVSFISLNLAVVNLLPIPVLDGGQILLLLPEFVLRRPLRERTRMLAYQAGMVILAGIMILIFYNDIRRLIPL